MTNKVKIIITILSVIGFYTAVFKFIEFDQEYFRGNLFISCILILIFIALVLAWLEFGFGQAHKEERFIGFYYLGVAFFVCILFYGIVIT